MSKAREMLDDLREWIECKHEWVDIADEPRRTRFAPVGGGGRRRPGRD